MQVVKYVFQPHGDERGQLVALEEFKDIPFHIKRVYYMYNTAEGVTRGYHAHKSLQQILVCIHELYDESDYIRNYDEFLEYVKNCGDTTSANEV